MPDGLYRIVTGQGGDTLTAKPGGAETAPNAGLDSQKWRLRTLGKGRVSLTAISGGRLGTAWIVVPQPDGFCQLRPSGSRNGLADTQRQEWSFLPVN